MPTATPKPPTIPDQKVPVIDLQSGRMNIDWYNWLARWEKIWRGIRDEIP